MSASSSTRRRRRHAPEFKQALVAQCQPGTSVAAVALAHGVNANLLHNWIKQYSGTPLSQAVTAPAKLVPVELDVATDSPINNINDVIEISIQKNNARINIRWPGQQAYACTQWLGEWLK